MKIRKWLIAPNEGGGVRGLGRTIYQGNLNIVPLVFSFVAPLTCFLLCKNRPLFRKGTTLLPMPQFTLYTFVTRGFSIDTSTQPMTLTDVGDSSAVFYKVEDAQ